MCDCNASLTSNNKPIKSKLVFVWYSKDSLDIAMRLVSIVMISFLLQYCHACISPRDYICMFIGWSQWFILKLALQVFCSCTKLTDGCEIDRLVLFTSMWIVFIWACHRVLWLWTIYDSTHQKHLKLIFFSQNHAPLTYKYEGYPRRPYKVSAIWSKLDLYWSSAWRVSKIGRASCRERV